MKEWFDSVPESVTVEDKNGSHNVFKTDNVFDLSVRELLNVLETDGEFYKNPSPEKMRRVLIQYVVKQVNVMLQDADWYITNAIPEFIKGELR